MGILCAQRTKHDDTLTKPAEKLGEVLVKAIRVDADSPVTHSNLDKSEIGKRNLGQDVPFLLNYLPSVVTTSDAGAGVGYTYIRVRGSDASRVNVTLNGIPYNDAESQGTYWVDLPDFASSIQNLQLQRGVGTSTNGSGAFGASLNMLTDAVSEKAYGEISNSYGSFNTWKHNVKFSTGLLQHKVEIAGRLSMLKSDGYIDRASSNLKSYYLQASYIDDNTLIKALTFGGDEKTYQAWYGIDDQTMKTDRTFNPAGMYTDENGNIQFYNNQTDNYKQDHFQVFWNQRYNNYWSTNLALNYTHGRGYYEEYKEDQDFSIYNFQPLSIGGETINSTDLVRRLWLDNDFYAINANLNYKHAKLEVNSGAFYSNYLGDHFGKVIWARYASNSEPGDNYYFSNATKNEFTVFSKATYRITNKLQAFLDLQGRFVHYDTGGITSDLVPININTNFNFFNPKTGISYQFNRFNELYGYYGRASREPARNDFEQGLDTPENLNDYELGYRYHTEKVKVNSNIYYMDYRNQLVLSGELNNVGTPLRTTSGSSYRLGLEVDADIQLGEKWKIMPNVSLSSNKNRDFVASIDGELRDLGKTNISYSPKVIASDMLVYKPWQNLQIGLLSKYVGKQYMGNIDSKTSILDGFFVNNLNLYYQIKHFPLFKEVVVNALVNNIFDVKYASNGYFYTYNDDYSNPGTIKTIEGAGYYPQAGINFLAGVTLKF